MGEFLHNVLCYSGLEMGVFQPHNSNIYAALARIVSKRRVLNLVSELNLHKSEVNLLLVSQAHQLLQSFIANGLTELTRN